MDIGDKVRHTSTGAVGKLCKDGMCEDAYFVLTSGDMVWVTRDELNCEWVVHEKCNSVGNIRPVCLYS